MEVTRKFAGASGVTHGEESSRLSFAPDLLREPAFFVGAVSQHVMFREAISTLHHVVTSDLRFRPKDRTEYRAWLETQKDEMLAEAAIAGRDASKRLHAARDEMRTINTRTAKLLRPYRQAEQKYFTWLYKVNRDAWFVLDPVIAVHPDEVSFECFSSDESTYGRLSCDLEMFDEINEVAQGVTNIDYSHALYDAFQQIRSYRRTELRIEPGGFSTSNEAGQEIFEEKIDLPESWVRGFLQVSSAMTLSSFRISLHPMDVHNLCFALRRKKEKHGPRSLRFVLKPGQPVEMVFEPWEDRIPCPRALYHGDREAEIRLWGRRRLMILERLIPLARRFDLYLLGTGLPAFVVADLGPMTFTLGLSGWTANDWSRAGQFDLLAPRRRTSAETRRRVLDTLSADWIGTGADIAARTGLDRAEVASALTILTQHGRAMYDLDKQLWRFRDILRTPLDIDALRFQSDRENKADSLLIGDFVKIQRREAHRIDGRITDDGRDHEVSIVLDDDDRLNSATCGCHFHRRNRLRKGPCEHILALRRAAAEEGTGNVFSGPWGRR